MPTSTPPAKKLAPSARSNFVSGKYKKLSREKNLASLFQAYNPSSYKGLQPQTVQYFGFIAFGGSKNVDFLL
jgi:hypothetical protein